MEFRAQDFAQLVLGYLKEARCKRAFLDLLYHSEHLREHANNYRNRRFVATRVAGMSLVEYLNEYAAIYTIVQERLEATDFYKENCSHSSLVEQVLHLFDKFDQKEASLKESEQPDICENIPNSGPAATSSSYRQQHVNSVPATITTHGVATSFVAVPNHGFFANNAGGNANSNANAGNSGSNNGINNNGLNNGGSSAGSYGYGGYGYSFSSAGGNAGGNSGNNSGNNPGGYLFGYSGNGASGNNNGFSG